MAHVKGANSGLWMPQSTHEQVDSQKMFVDNMNQLEANHTDLIGRISAQVNSISKLKALDVSSDTSTIKEGTVVLVSGAGLYYYTLLSSEEVDGEEVIAPNTGNGKWILSGGGGNLIVDATDYGEDTDSDQNGVALKIKKLFNKKLKTNFFPITTTKAVRDTSTGKSLFQLLNFIPLFEDGGEEAKEVTGVDAAMLGGIPASEYALKSDYNGIICVLVVENWTQTSDGNWVYTIDYPSMTGSEIFDLSLYDDGTATEDQIFAFSEYVTRIDIIEGQILIRASAKPSVTFSIILRGMCNISSTVVANLSDMTTAYNNLEARITALEQSLT